MPQEWHNLEFLAKTVLINPSAPPRAWGSGPPWLSRDGSEHRLWSHSLAMQHWAGDTLFKPSSPLMQTEDENVHLVGLRGLREMAHAFERRASAWHRANI